MLTPHRLTKLLALGLFLIIAGPTVVSAEVESCAVRDDAGAMTRITFDATGKLVAAPPHCLFNQDSVVFQVVDDPVFQEELIARDLNRYLDALRGLQTLEEEVTDNPLLRFKLLGLSLAGNDSDIAQVRREICQRARRLVGQLTDGADVFATRLDELACAAVADEPQPTFVPAEQPAEYSVRTRCFEVEGALGAKNGPYPLSRDNQSPGFLVSKPVPMNGGCAKVQYELRRTDPLVRRAETWAGLQQASQELRRLIEEGRVQLRKEPRPRTVVEKYKDFMACLKTALEPVLLSPNPTQADKDRAFAGANQCLSTATPRLDLAQADAEIAGALGTVNTIIADITRQVATEGWVKRWLWLTNGLPRLNPFQFLTERIRLEEQIRKDEDRLAELDSQVAVFELIATNQGLKVQDLSTLPAQLKPLAEIRLQRDRLRKTLEQARQRLPPLRESSDADDLLYLGELYLSQPEFRFSLRGSGPVFAVMQHHDAQNEYLVMAPQTVQEIRETERLYILAENEKEETKLKAAVTVTRISTDVSGISAEAALSRTGAAIAGLDATDPLTQFLVLFNNYNGLVAMLAFLEEQLDVPPIPFSPAEDKSPALLTRLVPHEVPSNAPAQVTYTINRKTGDKSEEVWKGEYRVNKLYRLRLKAGLVYSDQETSDFTITTTATAVTVQEETDRHGVDGTFGVQLYPFGRRDIRNPTRSDRWWPVLFTGFSIKSPKDDLFLGGGFEPWPGVTFLYGLQYGRSEELVDGDGGRKTTRSKWEQSKFYSILIDVDFFRQLFGLKGIL